MGKRVIFYTCVTGGYDNLQDPLAIIPDADYVCLVPRGEKNNVYSGVWQIVEFDSPVTNQIAASRYPKIMAHEFFPEYEYSLYIDGNIDIVSQDFYDVIRDKIKSESFFSAPAHPFTKCVYKEAYRIVKADKDHLSNVLKAVRFLKNKKFPRNFGLYENSILLRKHNDMAVKAVDTMWWKLFQSFPNRDQLTLTFCLRENKIAIDYLFGENVNARNFSALKLRKHPESRKKGLKEFIHRKAGILRRVVISLFLATIN